MTIELLQTTQMTVKMLQTTQITVDCYRVHTAHVELLLSTAIILEVQQITLIILDQ